MLDVSFLFLVPHQYRRGSGIACVKTVFKVLLLLCFASLLAGVCALEVLSMLRCPRARIAPLQHLEFASIGLYIVSRGGISGDTVLEIASHHGSLPVRHFAYERLWR